MYKSRMGRMRLHAAFGHCATPHRKKCIYSPNTINSNRIDEIPAHGTYPCCILEFRVEHHCRVNGVRTRLRRGSATVMLSMNGLTRLALMHDFNDIAPSSGHRTKVWKHNNDISLTGKKKARAALRNCRKPRAARPLLF
jgi:hypothetical protein